MGTSGGTLGWGLAMVLFAGGCGLLGVLEVLWLAARARPEVVPATGADDDEEPAREETSRLEVGGPGSAREPAAVDGAGEQASDADSAPQRRPR